MTFFMILAVILVQTSAAGSLRKAGLSEGTVGILPLFLFAAGILLKPRASSLWKPAEKNETGWQRQTNLHRVWPFNRSASG